MYCLDLNLLPLSKHSSAQSQLFLHRHTFNQQCNIPHIGVSVGITGQTYAPFLRFLAHSITLTALMMSWHTQGPPCKRPSNLPPSPNPNPHHPRKRLEVQPCSQHRGSFLCLSSGSFPGLVVASYRRNSVPAPTCLTPKNLLLTLRLCLQHNLYYSDFEFKLAFCREHSYLNLSLRLVNYHPSFRGQAYVLFFFLAYIFQTSK